MRVVAGFLALGLAFHFNTAFAKGRVITTGRLEVIGGTLPAVPIPRAAALAITVDILRVIGGTPPAVPMPRVTPLAIATDRLLVIGAQQ